MLRAVQIQEIFATNWFGTIYNVFCKNLSWENIYNTEYKECTQNFGTENSENVHRHERGNLRLKLTRISTRFPVKIRDGLNWLKILHNDSFIMSDVICYNRQSITYKTTSVDICIIKQYLIKVISFLIFINNSITVRTQYNSVSS